MNVTRIVEYFRPSTIIYPNSIVVQTARGIRVLTVS
jgi:hypothetical protein